MDPPSYGRGPSGEIWKIEDAVYDFVDLSMKLLTKNNSFLVLNSYTTGLQAGVMDYIVKKLLKKHSLDGDVFSFEIGVKCKSTNLILPEGNTVIFSSGYKNNL